MSNNVKCLAYVVKKPVFIENYSSVKCVVPRQMVDKGSSDEGPGCQGC